VRGRKREERKDSLRKREERGLSEEMERETG
jgi:hypothetical protein